MTITQTYFRATTKQIVVKEMSTRPYVGYEHPNDEPEGWLFDIKRWSSPFDLNLPSLPRLSNSSIQNISETSYFRSGVGATNLGDLFVEGFTEVTESGKKHWYPNVKNGYYYRYDANYFYYSDNSVIQYLASGDNRDGRNYIELNATPAITTPILASSFKRNALKSTAYNTHVKQKYKFTGIYSSSTELETISNVSKILWDNVDTTKREFVVDNTIDGLTRLFFNKDYIKQYGVIPTVYNDLGACEYIGISTGSDYQVFFLENFPVLTDSTFHLYVADATTWIEWTRVDTWWELINGSLIYPYPGGNKYFIDKDLGILYFGSASAGGVPDTDKYIIVTYKSTLRIEYEELDKNTGVVAIDSDVNPVVQSINQGFVCVTHGDTEAASITLEIDKQKTSGTYNPVEYGPISIGADYAILKANVLGVGGLPVANTEVGYSHTPSDLGYLDGEDVSISITNSLGDAYTNYQPPVSADELGFYTVTVRNSTHPYYPDDREVILKVSETGYTDKEDEIYLYQILKDDPIMGHEDLDAVLLAIYQSDLPAWIAVTDVIVDGDMEAVGIAAWTEYDCTVTKDTTIPLQQGAQHLRVTSDASGSTWTCVASQGILIIGKIYQITGWARSDGTETPLVTDGTFVWTGTTSTDWQYFSESFIADSTDFDCGFTIAAPAGTEFCEFDSIIVNEIDQTDYARWSEEMILEHSLEEWNGTTTTEGDTLNGRKVVVYQQYGYGLTNLLDDGTMEEVPKVDPVVDGDFETTLTDVIIDGDMEAATAIAWTAMSSVLSKDTTAPLHSGTQHLRVTAIISGAPIGAVAGQTILTAGKTYHITGWARSDTTEAPLVSVGLGGVIWIGGTTGNWEQFDETFVSDGTGVYLGFMSAGATLGTEYVEFDDVTVLDENGIWLASPIGITTRETSDLPDSTTLLRVTYNGISHPAVYQSTLTTSKSYRITGWARAGGTGTEYPRILHDGVSIWDGTVSTSWQYIDVIFFASVTSFSLQVYDIMNPGEYCDFDNIQAIEQNGHWDTSTDATIEKSTIMPQQGMRCLKITAPNSGAGTPVMVEAGQTLVTTVSEKYRVTGWVKSDGTQLPTVTNDSTILWTGTTSTDWQYFDETFIAAFTGIYIGFIPTGPTVGTEYIELDNILLVSYAEAGPLFDTTAINPITGSLGAYVPVRPLLAEKITDVSDLYCGYWRLIYPEGAVPDCGIGSGYTIGGYWVVSSRLTTFQAQCWSPYYNTYIYSNSIVARISLPNYLLGEYINSSSQKVPFGWKLVSDNDNVASGVDGATFITINPHSGPYEIIDLVGGTGGDDVWASAPYRSLNFSFTIS